MDLQHQSSILFPNILIFYQLGKNIGIMHVYNKQY